MIRHGGHIWANSTTFDLWWIVFGYYKHDQYLMSDQEFCRILLHVQVTVWNSSQFQSSRDSSLPVIPVRVILCLENEVHLTKCEKWLPPGTDRVHTGSDLQGGDSHVYALHQGR